MIIHLSIIVVFSVIVTFDSACARRCWDGKVGSNTGQARAVKPVECNQGSTIYEYEHDVCFNTTVIEGNRDDKYGCDSRHNWEKIFKQWSSDCDKELLEKEKCCTWKVGNGATHRTCYCNKDYCNHDKELSKEEKGKVLLKTFLKEYGLSGRECFDIENYSTKICIYADQCDATVATRYEPRQDGNGNFDGTYILFCSGSALIPTFTKLWIFMFLSYSVNVVMD